MATVLPVPVLSLDAWAKALTRKERSELHATAQLVDAMLECGRHDKALKLCAEACRFTPQVLQRMICQFPSRHRWLTTNIWDLFRSAMRQHHEQMPETKFWPERDRRQAAGVSSKVTGNNVLQVNRRQRPTSRVWPIAETRRPARGRKAVGA